MYLSNCVPVQLEHQPCNYTNHCPAGNYPNLQKEVCFNYWYFVIIRQGDNVITLSLCLYICVTVPRFRKKWVVWLLSLNCYILTGFMVQVMFRSYAIVWVSKLKKSSVVHVYIFANYDINIRKQVSYVTLNKELCYVMHGPSCKGIVWQVSSILLVLLLITCRL